MTIHAIAAFFLAVPSGHSSETEQLDSSPPVLAQAGTGGGEAQPTDAGDTPESASAVSSTSGSRQKLSVGDMNLQWYAGGKVRGGVASHNMGLMLGVRGGIIADGNITLGGAVFTTIPGLEPVLSDYEPRDRYLTFGYGGVEAGYHLSPEKAMHLHFHSLFGAGWGGHHSDVNYEGTDFIWVFEPGVELLINLTDQLQAGVGLGYRFAFGVNMDLSPGDNYRIDVLDGLNADLTMIWFL